ALYRGLMVNAQLYERGDVTTRYFNRGWNGGSSNAFYHIPDFTNVSGTQKSWGALESFANWGGYYKVIAQLNLCIAYIPRMADNVFSAGSKSKLLGEAYFLRALMYYHIATIWGNAPLVLDAIENSNQVIDDESVPIYQGRSTDIQVVESVLTDVGEAINRLDYGTPGTAAWGIRANKGSALALAGYANLWMAFVKQREGQANETYLSAALQQLTDVVQNGRYALESYSSETAVKELFRGQSNEAVFELNVSYEQGE